MKLFGIFSTKKASSFVSTIEEYLNRIDTSLIIFKDGVRSYLYNDESEFEKSISTMASLEAEAGTLRREIEN